MCAASVTGRPSWFANRQAFIWLSRGLNEALEDYRTVRASLAVTRCASPPTSSTTGPFSRSLKEALDTGVDIQIVFDARKDKPQDRRTAPPSRPPVSMA